MPTSKVCVVTGASYGLGSHIAKQLGECRCQFCLLLPFLSPFIVYSELILSWTIIIISTLLSWCWVERGAGGEVGGQAGGCEEGDCGKRRQRSRGPLWHHRWVDCSDTLFRRDLVQTSTRWQGCGSRLRTTTLARWTVWSTTPPMCPPCTGGCWRLIHLPSQRLEQASH